MDQTQREKYLRIALGKTLAGPRPARPEYGRYRSLFPTFPVEQRPVLHLKWC